MVHHLLRGDNFGIREGFHQRLQAEIEIRIAGGDHDFVQRFTAVANFSTSASPSFTLNWASNSTASFGPDTSVEETAKCLFLRVVRINGQRRGKDGRSERVVSKARRAIVMVMSLFFRKVSIVRISSFARIHEQDMLSFINRANGGQNGSRYCRPCTTASVSWEFKRGGAGAGDLPSDGEPLSGANGEVGRARLVNRSTRKLTLTAAGRRSCKRPARSRKFLRKLKISQ